jgi:hypothetical protein
VDERHRPRRGQSPFGAHEEERPFRKIVGQGIPQAQIQRHENGNEPAAPARGGSTTGQGPCVRRTAHVEHDGTRTSIPGIVEQLDQGRRGRSDDVLRKVVETDLVACREVAGVDLVVGDVAVIEEAWHAHSYCKQTRRPDSCANNGAGAKLLQNAHARRRGRAAVSSPHVLTPTRRRGAVL